MNKHVAKTKGQTTTLPFCIFEKLQNILRIHVQSSLVVLNDHMLKQFHKESSSEVQHFLKWRTLKMNDSLVDLILVPGATYSPI